MTENSSKKPDTGNALQLQDVDRTASAASISSSARPPTPTLPPPPTAATIDEDQFTPSYSHLSNSGFPEPGDKPPTAVYEDYSPSYNYLRSNNDTNNGQPVSSPPGNRTPEGDNSVIRDIQANGPSSGGNTQAGQGPGNQQFAASNKDGTSPNVLANNGGNPGTGGGIAETGNTGVNNFNQSGGVNANNTNQARGVNANNTNQAGGVNANNTNQAGGINANNAYQSGGVNANNPYQNIPSNPNQNALEANKNNQVATLPGGQNNVGGPGAPTPGDATGNAISSPADTKEDKEWISKFEQFTMKFLNKIFRRTQIERKMKNAVKPSATCKRGIPPEPPNQPPLQQDLGTQQQQQTFPTGGGYNPQADGFSPAIETVPQAEDEADEAQTVSELNAMLDQIAQEIPLISQQYVSLVTPLLSSLVELKGRDFRKTDNREIFRKVDDYEARVKCDAHVCLESVMSRLQSLANFIESIKTDSQGLRKFPRILTKCYSTESKICQEVCEVYSDDDFQTVNIKRMFKLKPKPPERPPWRLTYKSGNECFNQVSQRNASCAKSQQQMQMAPGASCGPQQQAIISSSSCPPRGKPGSFGCSLGGFPTVGGGSCGSKSSCGNCGCKKAPRFYSSYPRLSRRRYKNCNCGCCDEEIIPNICGIYFTRFRQIDPDDAPLMIEGHPVDEELFPSITNFQQIRKLDIPKQKLFMENPKCFNPMPSKPVCFGGAKTKKGFPCGGKNVCCKDPCKSKRDPSSCCGTGKKKRSKRRGNSCKGGKGRGRMAECCTSTTTLKRKQEGCAAQEQEQCQKDVMDMFGLAVAQVENMNGNVNGVQNFAPNMFGNFGGMQQQLPPNGGMMPQGMVATQTMNPPIQNMPYPTEMLPQTAPQFIPQQMMQQQFNGYPQQQQPFQNNIQQQEAYKQTQTQGYQQPTQPGQYQAFPPQPPSPQGGPTSPQTPPFQGGQYVQQPPQPPPQDPNSQPPSQQPPGYQAQYNYQMPNNPQNTTQQTYPPPQQQLQQLQQQQPQNNPFFGGLQQHQAFRMEQNEQPLDQLSKILQQNTINALITPNPQSPFPGPGAPYINPDSTKKQVFARFIAQMYAAGTVTKEDAQKMTGIVCQRLLPFQQNRDRIVLQVMQAHVSTQTLSGPRPPSVSCPGPSDPHRRPQSASRSPSPQPQSYSHSRSPSPQPQNYSRSPSRPQPQTYSRNSRPQSPAPVQQRNKGSSMYDLRSSAQSSARGGVAPRSCGPNDGCPSGIIRGGGGSGVNDVQDRMRQSGGNRVSYAATQTFVSPTGRISHDVRSYLGSDGRSSRTVITISSRAPGGSQCSVRLSRQCGSKCSVGGSNRPSRSTCPRRSGTSITPEKDDYGTPPGFGDSRNETPRTSGDYDPGSRKSSFPPDDPGSRKPSFPPDDTGSRRSSGAPDDPGSRRSSGAPDDPGSRRSSGPPGNNKDQPGNDPNEDDGKNRSPSGGRTPENTSPVTSPKASPITSPKTSPQPSPPATPKSAGSTPSKPSRSASLISPSPPVSAKSTTDDETDGLVWPQDPLRGPLDKPPPPPIFPVVPKTKPGKNYKSPFKFQKIKPPPPPACDVILNDLPECHPLKTPYPPQYRFDNLKMRRYLEQCNLQKQICKLPQGEQCWVPPPPPLPPQFRDKKPPFPPDKCNPSLFPYSQLGMGCNMGLPSGNCYGRVFDGSNNNKQSKPEKDCYFDCGGVCPMGVLGENCPPPPPPPYSKLKKKQKADDVFFFDYITVKRDKKPEATTEADHCELYQQKLLEEQRAIEEMCNGKKGKRKKKNSNGCDPNTEVCAPPEITRFLKRPDVQVVKEQKTEIVRKHGMEGPERMITQMEAFYTKSPDGRVTTQWQDPNANDGTGGGPTLPTNVNPGVEQWVKAEVDASRRKNDHSHRFADDCPQLQTQWEKEFLEFAKSCDRPKKTKKNAAQLAMMSMMPPPPPPGMIPCPLPETTPIMCRIPDPNNMSGNVIQCQAIPFPMNSNQTHLQFGTEGSCVGGSPYQQAWSPYPKGGGGNPRAPQPVGGQYPIPPPTAYSEQSGQGPIPPPPQYVQSSNGQTKFQTGFPSGATLPFPQSSNEFSALPPPLPQYQQQYQQAPGNNIPPPVQYQQAPGNIPPPAQYQQVSNNGYSKYAPYQPVKYADAAMDISQQPKTTSKEATVGQKTDYPFMCEVRYHEPITGSIYGKLVTRQQPCRLVESNSVPPGHDPECPVMMETPFFNPTCRQPNNSQSNPPNSR
ncbi:unnamed protein product [Orchesella dallaii]|uniref:Uncharacterized protein n=1 Tax=Orchesella dallaii TaxID=48710 RepID=A0ABP1REF9_9HEXA